VKKQRNYLGKLGENEAVKYLEELGFKVLEKNFFNRYSEIDIIAERDDILYFIEVKTRSSLGFGSGFDAIDLRKIEKIKKGVEYYIQSKGVDKEVQLWAISILDSGGNKRLEFLKIN